MNNERLSLLLKYMNGLNALNDGGHRCNSEIDECIGWIREEFTKEPKDPFALPTLNGFIDKGRNGID